MSQLLLYIWNRWSSSFMCANHILPPIECASAPSEVQMTICHRASPVKDWPQCVQTGGEDGHLHLGTPRWQSPPLLLPGCTTNISKESTPLAMLKYQASMYWWISLLE
jgi:hypothetical protein